MAYLPVDRARISTAVAASLAIALIPVAAIALDDALGQALQMALGGALIVGLLAGSITAMTFMSRARWTARAALFWATLLLGSALGLASVWNWLQPLYATDPVRAANWLDLFLNSKAYQPGRLALMLALPAAAAMLCLHLRPALRDHQFATFAPPLLLAPSLLFAAIQGFQLMVAGGAFLAAGGFAAAAALALVALAARIVRTDAFSRVAFPLTTGQPADGLDRNNRWFMWLYGVMTPAAASAGSVLYGAAAVWGAASIASRRFPLRLFRSDRVIVAASVAYVAVFALTTFVNTRPGDHVGAQYLKLLPFLAIGVVIVRLRLTPPLALLEWLRYGAVTGLFAVFPIAVYEAAFAGLDGRRAVVFSGNPTLLAYAAAVFVVIALLGLDRMSFRRKLLHLAAAGFGLIVVVLTGTLSVSLALPVIVVLAAIRYPEAARWASRLRGRFGVRKLAVAAAVVAVVIAAAATPLLGRVAAIADGPEISAIGEVEGSLGKRLVMWRAGLDAASDALLSGHGVHNRFAAIRPYMTEAESHTIDFSQLHNGFVTAAVAGGLGGLLATIALLLAPVWTAWRNASGGLRGDAILLASGVTAIYAVAGLFTIMFFNDALDAIFCMMAALVAVLSAPQHRDPPPTSRPRT